MLGDERRISKAGLPASKFVPLETAESVILNITGFLIVTYSGLTAFTFDRVCKALKLDVLEGYTLIAYLAPALFNAIAVLLYHLSKVEKKLRQR